MHFSHTHQGPAGKATKIAVVAALHLAIGSVLIHSMNSRTFTMPRIVDDLTVEMRNEADPPPLPPEPLQQVKQQEPPEFIVPIVEVPVPPQPSEPTVTAVRQTDAPPAEFKTAGPSGATGGDTGTVVAKPAVMRSAVLADAKSCVTPDYPARAARNGETGTVKLALLVGASGSVLESRILSSSGSRELDRAAQAALSMCAFKPAMEGSVPQQGWAQIAYVWTLD